jgi:hypothetical protein
MRPIDRSVLVDKRHERCLPNDAFELTNDGALQSVSSKRWLSSLGIWTARYEEALRHMFALRLLYLNAMFQSSINFYRRLAPILIGCDIHILEYT